MNDRCFYYRRLVLHVVCQKNGPLMGFREELPVQGVGCSSFVIFAKRGKPHTCLSHYLSKLAGNTCRLREAVYDDVFFIGSLAAYAPVLGRVRRIFTRSCHNRSMRELC